MSKDCTLDDLTVDATVHGDVIEVDNFDGTKRFMASGYREILPDNIHCYGCEEDIMVDGFTDINEVVKEHLEEK